MRVNILLLTLLMLLFITSCTPSQTTTFAVLSDVQGDAGTLERVLSEVGAVDFIVFLGDANEYGNEIDDDEELKTVFELLSNATVPVYVLPGNHENKADYYAALEGTDLIDLSSGGFFDFRGFDIVSVPGYHLAHFPAEDGFIFTSVDVSFIADDPVVLFAHGPPLGFGDSLYSGEQVGSKALADFVEVHDIRFGFFGHIHESGGIALDVSGETVPENKWSDSLFLNVGSVKSWKLLSGEQHDGMAALVTFDGKRMKYQLVK